MRHQGPPDQVARGLFNLGRGVDQLDAAGLAATAGMDLGLDDVEIGLQRIGNCAGAFRRIGRSPFRNRDAELAEQFLGLILVNVHQALEFDSPLRTSIGT